MVGRHLASGGFKHQNRWSGLWPHRSVDGVGGSVPYGVGGSVPYGVGGSVPYGVGGSDPYGVGGSGPSGSASSQENHPSQERQGLDDRPESTRPASSATLEELETRVETGSLSLLSHGRQELRSSQARHEARGELRPK